MSPHDSIVVLAQARSLRRAAAAGRIPPLLRGKNFGLLCDSVDADDALLFRRAVSELGANVAHVRPVLNDSSSPQDVQHTARMLGRLYDAIECQGLAPALVRRMARDAGVPVYDGVATARHPTAGLADQLEGDDVTLADKRRFVLQAVLLHAVA